ncbi:MAG: hypothetical protein FJ405_00405 [Verrucomicrobia bacterium]|nr:hypothetical protein [Verrucomicrobiota bacterium]
MKNDVSSLIKVCGALATSAMGSSRLALTALLLILLLPLTSHPALAPNSEREIRALMDERNRRSPTERKLDSKLLFACRLHRGELPAPGVARWNRNAVSIRDNEVLLDLKANPTPALLREIQARGGRILNSFSGHRAVRCWLPIQQVELLAANADVEKVRPAEEATTNVGAITSEADVTHRADTARARFATQGEGIKIGVLSDSVTHLADSQARGELPVINVIPGQAGVGTGEGTAMLELIHDLAPAAELYFASAFNGVASFAENIRALRAAGCQIIVDDVTYFSESPFQDGPIAQAVNNVSASGALFFSSAGNSGNKSDGTSSVWEGDFADGGPASIGRGGRLHDFGGTTQNLILPGSSSRRVDLFWTDALGKSANDYDVYVLDAAGSVVVSSSNVQNGNDDPYESISTLGSGEKIVVVKQSGQPRFLWLSAGRAALSISTTGTVRGHNASGASNAFSVAATWVRSPAVPFAGSSENPVERFSSGGPRRMFFHPDGSPVTPGNVTATGGIVLQKPDITAADGTRTSVPGFETFFGTSAAAPHAAAIAALLWSYNPSLSPGELRQVLQTTALDIETPGFDLDSGHGIVMAEAALEAAPSPLPNLGWEAPVIAGGNGNGSLDANECAQLFLALRNRIGPIGATATGVSATLRSLTGGISVDPAPVAFADVPASSSTTNPVPFLISTSPDYLCGSPALFELRIQSTERGLQTETLALASSPTTIGPPLIFPAGSVPMPIPDLSSIQSDLTVSGVALPIAEVSVDLYASHSYVSDLIVELVGPDGTTVQLAARKGNNGQNYGVSCASPTVFTDDTTNLLAFGSAPFTGAFKPEQPLSVFRGKVGQQVNGTWSLRITDAAEPDSGNLVCWKLNLRPVQCQDASGACFQPPLITLQPQSVTVVEGTPAMFSATASGSQPLVYQWYFNATNPLPGASNPNLSIPSVAAENVGAYTLLVSNPYGSVTSSPAFLSIVTAPVFIQQPSGLIALEGTSVALYALASGTPPISYQWFGESQGSLPGATNSELRFSPASALDSGNYRVVASNPFGATTSLVARVDVGQPPVITSQPLDVTVSEGGLAQFTITASGTPPLGYEWRYNENTVIQGASSSTLSLSPVSRTMAGGYLAVVTNLFGRASSAQASLTVLVPNQPPQITLTSPSNNTSITRSNLPVRIEATASDSDGSVTSVQLLVNGLPLISLTQSPYTHEWPDPAPGTHSIQAIATDDLGGRSTSAVAVVSVSLPRDSAAYLVSAGSVWKYLDDGSDQGTSWIDADFSDVAWSSGPAELGYGDGPGRPEATVIGFGGVENKKFITYYFRKKFHIADAASYTNLLMRILRDDGSSTYLNGTEIHRSNLPGGSLNHQTLALSAITGNNETLFVETNVPSQLLRDGWNTLAVEVHQNATNSSDLSFDFELIGDRSLLPRITLQPESLSILAGQEARFRVGGLSPSPLSYQWFFNLTQAVAGATAETYVIAQGNVANGGTYTAVLSNRFGSVASTAALLTFTPPDTNEPPSISISSPLDGTLITGESLPLMIRATASDPNHDPLIVEFFIDGQSVGTLENAPYDFAWLDPSPGLHRLQAIATDPGLKSATSAVVSVTFEAPASRVYPLISLRTSWRYDDRGIDLGETWTPISFSETGWKQGVAELGYGDESDGRPEATVLSFGTNENNKHPTAYFRKSFVLTDPESFPILRFRILRDDGVQVHLNGEALFTDNLPPGPIRFTDYAITAITRAGETNLLVKAFTNAPLQKGMNVLAVEVHQNGPRSSDLSFDLAMDGFRLPRPTLLTQPTSLSVSNGLDAGFSVVAEGAPILRYQWYFNDTNALSGGTNATLLLRNVQESQSGLYTCEVSNDFGSIRSSAARLTVLSPARNLLPEVVLTSPTAGAVVAFGGNIFFQAKAANPDGSVARVDFYVEERFVGSDSTEPYELEWVEGTSGERKAFARAFDNQGFSADSQPVTFSVSAAPVPTLTLIPRGAAWRYLDTGVDQRTAWRAPGFNDESWPEGEAVLGYGNAAKGQPEATLLNPGKDPNAVTPTYYFRNRFVVLDRSRVIRLTFRTLRDDGVRVFLQGSSLYRDNLPSGSTFTTLASRPITGPEETVYLTNSFTSSGSAPCNLKNGTNVLAVEVHQASLNSDDLAFDLSLEAEISSAPIIAAQPAPLAVKVGETAAFGVAAYGTGTLSYRWFGNGTNLLANQTAPYLRLSNVTTNQAGDYTVEVRNAIGVTISAPARLTVIALPPNQPPTIALISPAPNTIFQQGQLISIEAQASDADGRVARVDLFDNTNHIARLTNAPYVFDWAGALAGERLLRGLAVDDQGATNVSASISVFVTPLPPPPGSSLTLISTGAVWRFLDNGEDQGTAWRSLSFDDSGWSNGVAQLGYGDGDETTVLQFGPTAGNKHPTYYFRHSFDLPPDGPAYESLVVSLLRDDGGVVYLNDEEIFRSNMPTGTVVFLTLAASTVDKVEEGAYFETNASPSLLRPGKNVVAVEIHQVLPTSTDVSFDLRLTGVPISTPSILLQPGDVIVARGASASFETEVRGAEPLSYQWFLNGLIPILGANGPDLVLQNVQPADEGSYSLLVTNAFGEVRSRSAILTVVRPPLITLQPSSQTADEGGIAEFSVAAQGTPPLAYQWLYDGNNPISNATNPVLRLLNLRVSDAGSYSVRITNLAGSTLSQSASLSVASTAQPVRILTQPTDVVLLSPGPASFTVEASGTAPITYQWLLNGTTEIPGANSPTFTLANTGIANMAAYSVRVSNPVNTVTSESAELRILVRPTIQSVSITANGVVVTFPSLSRLRYTLEATASLTNPTWTPVAGGIQVKGTGLKLGISDPTGVYGKGFYRVRVE